MNYQGVTFQQPTQSVNSVFEAENELIDEVTNELAAIKVNVTGRDIMLALISRLELEKETDVIRNDILRNALELVALRTQEI